MRNDILSDKQKCRLQSCIVDCNEINVLLLDNAVYNECQKHKEMFDQCNRMIKL